MNKNSFIILDKYFNKKEFLNEIRKSIIQSIEEITNLENSKSVEKYGLKKIHNYFPVEFIPFLQYALEEKIKNLIYENIYLVSKNNLKLNNFLIDKTINVRIHYPINIEKKSKLSRKIYRCLDLRNYKNSKLEFQAAKKKSLKYKFDISDITKVKYFNSQNNSIYHHSPHKDTWFGHCTEDGINFWWGVTSVNELNGLMLFRDIYDHNIKHETEPAYVEKEYALGKIEVPKLKEGSLLIFDPEILHGTRINTSEDTRLVISGRINKSKPSFYKNYRGSFIPKWITSSDVEKKFFDRTLVIKRKDSFVQNDKKKKSIKKNNYRKIIFRSNIKNNTNYKIIKYSSFKNMSLLLIKFNNFEICLKKNNSKIFAFNNICPHLQFKLINSYNENNFVTCNGHGLKFNLKNGLSTCRKYNLKTFKTFTKDNFIFIRT